MKRPLHEMSDHGFLECRIEDATTHFATEDLPFVAHCPFCGSDILPATEAGRDA
jgi:hypothetical protein